jgi:hypothetical protein
MLSGQMSAAKWAAEMGKASFYRGIYENPKMGGKLLRIVQGKVPEGEITAMDQAHLSLMAEGGFVPGMPEQHRMGMLASYRKAREQGSASMYWKAPLAAIDAMQTPLMERWIPSLKIASYLKDAKTALEADPTLLDNPARRREALRKISKSIDNRYGEMAYDTLFWNKWVKDVGVASSLSLGWNLGFLREYGGAGIEMGQAALREGSFKSKVARGDLDRAMFVLFYSAQSLMYGGLMTYLFTGKSPENLLDYTYPKDGEKNPDGTDHRVSTMFYPKEFVAIAKHMENEGIGAGLSQTAINKLSPALSLMWDFWEGSNYFGEEFRDPNGTIVQKTQQTLAFAFKEILPISVTSMQKGTESLTPKKVALSVGGFSPAPRYVTETTAEGRITALYKKYFGAQRKPYERVALSKTGRELRELYMRGNTQEYYSKLREATEKFELTAEERNKLVTATKSKIDPYVEMFSVLPWQRQKLLLDEMPPEERAKYLPHSNAEHLRRKYQPPKE